MFLNELNFFKVKLVLNQCTKNKTLQKKREKKSNYGRTSGWQESGNTEKDNYRWPPVVEGQ